MHELILGDNQFLGVNHRSEDLGRKCSHKFNDKKKIFNFLSECRELGINSFMFTTHDKIMPVLSFIEDSTLFEDYSLYPCLPYAHKYANSVTEKGVFRTVSQFTYSNLLSFIYNGCCGLVSGNAKFIMKSLVDAELEKVPTHLISCVYLQNLVTDLLLGLGMEDLMLEFADHINRKYDCEVGFVTMNYPLLAAKIANQDSDLKYRVCLNVNKNGFRMNPCKDKVLEKIKYSKNHLTAMSIFASGSLFPDEAIEYITSVKGLNSYLFGSSSITNVKKNIYLFNKS